MENKKYEGNIEEQQRNFIEEVKECLLQIGKCEEDINFINYEDSDEDPLTWEDFIKVKDNPYKITPYILKPIIEGYGWHINRGKEREMVIEETILSKVEKSLKKNNKDLTEAKYLCDETSNVVFPYDIAVMNLTNKKGVHLL